jgi:hypothetical protein
MTKEELEKQTMEWKNNYLLKLEEENAELKKSIRYCNRVYNDNLDYSHHIEGQLTNAKEIIQKLKALYLSPVVTKDDVKRQDEILAEVEQFLKECK